MQIKSDLGEDLRWKINGKKIRNNGEYYNQHFHKNFLKGNYTRRVFWINMAVNSLYKKYFWFFYTIKFITAI